MNSPMRRSSKPDAQARDSNPLACASGFDDLRRRSDRLDPGHSRSMETREVAREPQEISCPERFPVRPGVGCLLIVGGAGTPQVVYDEFFRLAGGPLARVLHVPSATKHFA